MRAESWRWFGVVIQLGAWVVMALLAWPDHVSLLVTPWIIMFVAFGLAGLLLVVRRPQHPVGWLALALGVMSSLGIVGIVVASRLIDGGATEAGAWADAAGNAVMTSGMLAAPAILILFPDGTVPRRYGRPLLWVILLAALVGAGAALLNGGWGGDPAQAIAPSPLREQTAPLGDALAYAFYILLASSMIGAGASLLIRWRRSQGLERQQIKWLAVGTTLAVLAMAASGFNTSEQWEIVVAATAFSTIPVAIVAAILRYRLYEIDRIISRTVSYAIVVGLMGVLFVMLAVGLPNLLTGVDDSPLLVAVSTLAVAALFNPLRRRIQVLVDRRFNRSRYDAGRVMDEFAGSLRNQVDSNEVIEGWMSVVETTMQPASVGVWVRS
jgi:hypothetical protein